MDAWINPPRFQKYPVHHESREIRTIQPGPRKDPFPAPVAAAVVDIVAEVVVDRIAIAEAVVESDAVEQTAVVSGSWHDRVAKVTESEVAEKGWLDARAVSVHTQPGTTSSETVAVAVVAVDSMVSAVGPGPERLRWCCFGRS